MNPDGRELGMWFHDTDSHQGYYVSYEAFQSPGLALVRTELETRISLEDLQNDITQQVDKFDMYQTVSWIR